MKGKSLALEEESRATLGPSGLVTTARHVKTCDSLVTISTVIDWDRDALALRIGVSSILERKRSVKGQAYVFGLCNQIKGQQGWKTTIQLI